MVKYIGDLRSSMISVALHEGSKMNILPSQKINFQRPPRLTSNIWEVCSRGVRRTSKSYPFPILRSCPPMSVRQATSGIFSVPFFVQFFIFVRPMSVHYFPLSVHICQMSLIICSMPLHVCPMTVNAIPFTFDLHASPHILHVGHWIDLLFSSQLMWYELLCELRALWVMFKDFQEKEISMN